jgi:DNA-binding transcriptional LysR family regulator
MDLSTKDVRAFVAVARNMSYVHAARDLGYTEPGVHYQVKQLEAILGCTVFARSGRGLRLTDEGKAILPVCKSLLADIASLADRIESLGRDRIVIAAGVITGTYILPEMIVHFLRNRPNVNVELHTEVTPERILYQVENCEADIGVCARLHIPVRQEDTTIVLWRQHHRALLTSTPCDPTPGERLTVYAVEQMTEGLSKLLGLFGRLGYQTPIIRFVPSSEVAKVYCLNGLGLAFLTTNCVEFELQSRTLREVKLAESIDENIWLAYLRNKPARLRDEFLQLLLDSV